MRTILDREHGCSRPTGVAPSQPKARPVRLLAVRGMGPCPMSAKRNRPEGYPMGLAKAPARLGLGVEQGAGLPVGSVAEKPEGRSGAARVLANGVQGWSALGVGPSLHSPAPVCIAPASSLNAGTLFFIARNEGSSMAPDNYACIHRM